MTDNVVIPRFDPGPDESVFDAPPNHWTSDIDGTNVFIKCPDENHMIMSIRHAITKEGLLKPSLRCPTGEPEHFHVFATLEDWDFEAKAEGINYK